MKTLAIVQARMGSSRFPAKVMQPVNGMPMIELLLSRLSRAREVDEIVVATADSPRDAELISFVRGLGVAVHVGSERDVLDRFYKAALAVNPDIVVRITGDCPLIDPAVVDDAIRLYKTGGVDYASNVDPPTFPDGLDVEVFSFASLSDAWNNAKEAYHREHVTPYIRESGLFRKSNLASPEDHSSKRWTVDEPEDLDVVRKVCAHFAPRTDFGWHEVIALERAHPEIFVRRELMKRNAGAAMSEGQKLWARAKRVIPGGSMLLSKRPEMFLPELWPTYFSRAKGITVWDLEGRAYEDFSIMGVGTNSLGYGDPEVDAAVKVVVEAGNLSTFNCPEEVYLAERMVELHPWADMVRYARTGGEVNAIAVRIARAATGKDKIAFCGYHGWHDWYLAANLSDGSNLGGHLLPGLEPRGVPQYMGGSVLPFNYNRFDELEAIVNSHEIGTIVMEVSRNNGPEPGFLESVRELATRKGIVLLFDECTSGFRQSFGGLHKIFNVEPDIATFGKALGNGYAITCVIGRREVMEYAQSTFISSTFWTERIGPAAALKTLEVMDRVKSWETITATGRAIQSRWQKLAGKHGFEINLWGLPALAGFTIKSERAQAYKTLITQEMLAKGYLAGNSVYLSTAHTPEKVEAFFEALDPVFALIGECENGRDVTALLKGPIAHSGFRRLN